MPVTTQPKRISACVALVAALALPLGTAQAGMIGTEAAVNAASASAQRSALSDAFNRAEVRRAFQAQGVSPAEAQARLDAMTDAEVQQLVAKVDDLPAGGLGVLGAVAVVAIIFVITDAMGVTNVYNFVVPQR